jgi:hypothetical protein
MEVCMRIIIDRFEGDHAVCELSEREMVNINKCLIPENAKEGDVLNINITIDISETNKRKSDIKKLEDELWQ